MCPPIGALPQSNPFTAFNMPGLGKPGTPDKAGGPAGTAPGTVDGGRSVKSGSTPDTASSTAPVGLSKSSLTAPTPQPGGADSAASTERLVKMAIEATKDGPAATFLGKVMLENAAQQREAAIKDMMAARQSAYAQTMSGADQLEKAGHDSQNAAIASLVLGLTSSAVNFTGKMNEKGQSTTPRTSAIGTGLGSGAEFANTKGQSQAKLDEADQKRDEAGAQQAEMVADRKKDTLEKLEELTKQVIAFLHDFQETNNDMMAAITRA